MKVKVIKNFNDKTADFVTRKVGEQFDPDTERAKELIAKGFVEKVTEPADKPKTTKK